MTQTIDEILGAIGGQTSVPHQPEGGSSTSAIPPLGPIAQGRVEGAPASPGPQQGAGVGSGGLTPGAQGSPTAGDGAVEPGADDHYADQGGPQQLPVVPGIGALTAGGSFGGNRPLDGDASTAPAASPVSRPDHKLGRDQGAGTDLNPALHWARTGK